MRDLTDRQRAVLAFMINHCVEHRQPPAIREIGAAFDIGSTNGVSEYLRALVRKGYAAQEKTSAQRGVWPVRDLDGAPISWRLSYVRGSA